MKKNKMLSVLILSFGLLAGCSSNKLELKEEFVTTEETPLVLQQDEKPSNNPLDYLSEDVDDKVKKNTRIQFFTLNEKEGGMESTNYPSGYDLFEVGRYSLSLEYGEDYQIVYFDIVE